MPCGRKRKRHKMATHKRKKRLRKNRHKKRIRQFFEAILAQLVEQLIRNEQAAGSNPADGSELISNCFHF